MLAVGELAVRAPGVLAMTDEYTTGTIRVSLAAVLRRLRLLAGGQGGGCGSGDPVGLPGVAQAVVATGAFLALLTLFGAPGGTPNQARPHAPDIPESPEIPRRRREQYRDHA